MRNSLFAKSFARKGERWGTLDKAPRLSIRIVILILPSDTETSAATPCGAMRKK